MTYSGQGGMVNTYIDPKAGTPYDYGVESFLDIGNASALFDRFGLELITTQYIDFNSGNPGNPGNLSPPSSDTQIAAMEKFLDVVKPWTDYSQPGYWNFPAPEDIPEDFLIPYGEFITKYGLEDAIPIIYECTGTGLGNMTQETTMFVLQAFGTNRAEPFLVKMIPTIQLREVTRRYTTLLNKIWVMMCCITALFSTAHLLIAIEPTAMNTAPLDLSTNERTVLSKFTYTREYSGIVNNSAFVVPMSCANMAAGGAPDNYLILPDSSLTNKTSYMGDDNLFHVIIVGNNTLDEHGAKALLQENFETLLKAGRLGEPYEDQQINWFDFSVHGPMHAREFPEDVKARFFEQLFALQGQRSTW